MGGLYFERDGGALVIMQKKVCERFARMILLEDGLKKY